MKRKNLFFSNGFTLVELIVVVAILAIIATIAIPNVTGYIDTYKRQNDERLAEISVNAMAMYCTHYNLENTSGNDTLHTSEEWITLLIASGFLSANEIESGTLILESDYYESVDFSGPDASGVCTVTLNASGTGVDYVVKK